MGSISDHGGLLYFDFRFSGRRCREYTKLSDTPINRRKMKGVLKKVESDIALNLFEYGRYFPNSPMVSKFREAALFKAVDETLPPPQAADVVVLRPAPTTPLFRDFVETWKAQRQIEWRHSWYRVEHGCGLHVRARAA